MASRDIIKPKPKPQVSQIITGKTTWVPEESQFINEITLATLKRHEDEDLAKANAESLKYNDEENNPIVCGYHPGKPIFHDTKKGWTCCNKIVYDWGEF